MLLPREVGATWCYVNWIPHAAVNELQNSTFHHQPGLLVPTGHASEKHKSCQILSAYLRESFDSSMSDAACQRAEDALNPKP